jgi:tRNA (cytidine/uridine-2'-O-)-methyltransferase
MTATGSPSNADETATRQAESNPPPPRLHVVLYQPQIPQNTGNIARTCVALRAKLWIVRPTMFRLDSSQLKRAGLDYWQYLAWEVVDSWEDLLNRFDRPRFWLVSKFGQQAYYEADFQPGDIMVLGRETDGLPLSLRQAYREQMIHIPMPGEVRSLNLANAAAIVMYEAARKIGMLDGCSGVPME